jgi:hypothetical protein
VQRGGVDDADSAAAVDHCSCHSLPAALCCYPEEDSGIQRGAAPPRGGGVPNVAQLTRDLLGAWSMAGDPNVAQLLHDLWGEWSMVGVPNVAQLLHDLLGALSMVGVPNVAHLLHDLVGALSMVGVPNVAHLCDS